MFPKEIISVYLPKKVTGPRRFMLTKTSELEPAVHSILNSLEKEVNKRLHYFMYDVEDKMDYLIESDDESPFYFDTICKEIGATLLEKEIKEAFKLIPDYSLYEELPNALAELMFNWIREKYLADSSKGINSINTEENQQNLTNEIRNFNFQEDVLVLAKYNQEAIMVLFEEVISQIKEVAPTISAYLEKHEYFKEVSEMFEKDLNLNSNHNPSIVISSTKDIIFVD